jgi:cobalamin biosynthesis protein CobT
MKVRSILVAATWLALVASTSAEAPTASKELLQGNWTGVVEINEEELKTDEKFKELPPEQAPLVLKLVKDQFSQMKISLSFNADGTTTGEFSAPDMPAQKKETGTWEVVKTDGASITVRIISAKDKAEAEAKQAAEEEEEEEGDDEDSEEEESEEEESADEASDEQEVSTEGKKEIDEITFTFSDEKTIVATNMGDALPKGVTFKFTKK